MKRTNSAIRTLPISAEVYTHLHSSFLSENRVRKSVVRYTRLNYYPDMLIGYARVSTDDQNLDLQRDALLRVGCERIFEEKESGRAGTKRPAFEAALAFLRPEDQLVVWKVDRLGRSLREMLDTAHKLQAQGVRLRSLTEAVDTETPTGRLMFNFLGTIAEYFLDLNRERTLEGLKAAAARGRKGGRPKALSEAGLQLGEVTEDDTRRGRHERVRAVVLGDPVPAVPEGVGPAGELGR